MANGTGGQARGLVELPSKNASDKAVAGLQEVPSERSRFARAYEDPETGGAHLYQVFTEPINYRSPQGKWRAIDTSLVPEDGGYVTAANSHSSHFPRSLTPSRGPRLVLPQGSVELVHEGLMPSVGSVSDNSITYPKVAPGTDVRFIAGGSGFTEHLLLADRDAQKTFVYRVVAEGLELQEMPGGVLALMDEGLPVGFLPIGVAEESADGVAAGGGPDSVLLDRTLERIAPDQYRVTETLPDAWADDPATQYPVLVDPDLFAISNCYPRPNISDMEQNQDYLGHCFYRNYPWRDSYIEKDQPSLVRPWELVVKTGKANSNEYKAFVDFPFLNDEAGAKVIHAADFKIHNAWSSSSTATPVNLHEVTREWRLKESETGTWLNWNNWSEEGVATPALDQSPPACGNNYSSCSPWHVFNVKSYLQKVQTNNWDHERAYGWRLQAPSHLTNTAKSFDSKNEDKACQCQPYLMVSANSQPAKPVLTAPADDSTINTRTPQLKIQDVTDPNGDAVQVRYQISTSRSFETIAYTSAWIDEAHVHEVTNPTALDPGVTYYWRVRAKDNFYDAEESAGLPTAVSDSATRTFRIENVPPTPPGNVMSTSHIVEVPYQDRTVDMTWSASTDSESGLAGYQWKFTMSETPDFTDASDAPASATGLTSAPLDDGKWYFHIRAIDNVGNVSLPAKYGRIVISKDGLVPTLGPEAIAQSDELGLEQFMPYRSHNLGIASAFVQLRTGNVVVQGEDVTVPSKGLNAVIRHTYNSKRAEEDSGVGLGWSLSVSDLDSGLLDGLGGAVTDLDVNAPLRRATVLVGQTTGSVLEFTDGDGTTHRFVRPLGATDHRWQSPPGVSLRVREEVDPTTGLVDAYELVRPDGVTYRAEECLVPEIEEGAPIPEGDPCSDDGVTGDQVAGEFRIVSISDRNGNRLLFEHSYEGDVAHLALRLVAVHSDPIDGDSRRVVLITYTPHAHVDKITSLPDSTTGGARTIEYNFVPEGSTAESDLLQSIVEHRGTDDARTSKFEYNTVNRLISVKDGRGHGSSFTYGEGRVKTFDDRGGNRWTYSIPEPSSGEMETTVTSPAPASGDTGYHQGVTTYRTSSRQIMGSDNRFSGGNIIRITDAGNQLGSDGSVTRRVVQEFAWEQNYLVSKTTIDPNSADPVTKMRYNALGLVTEVESPSVNDPARTDLLQGAPTGRIVTKIDYAADPGDDYAYSSGTCDPPSSTAESSISTDLYCQDVADVIRTTTGIVRTIDNQNDDHDDLSSSRTVDFAYVDNDNEYDDTNGDGDRDEGEPPIDEGNLERIIERSTHIPPANCDKRSSCDDAGNDRVTNFSYYPFGGIATINGPRDPADIPDHDGVSVDDLTKVGDPDLTDCGDYDPTGLPLCIVDAKGAASRFTYDGYGRVLTEVDREGRTTTNEYDLRGNLEWTIDHEGDRTSFTYDDNDNLKTEMSPRGNETSAVTDDFETRHLYDVLDRPTESSTPGKDNDPVSRRASETSYYPDGTKKSDESAAGAITTYSYFPNGSLREIEAPAASGGPSAETTVSYDALGRRKTVTFPSNGTSVSPSQEAFYSLSGTVTRIDETSPRATTSAPRDRSTLFDYDAHGAQLRVLGPRVNDVGHKEEQRNSYDVFGQQVSMRRLVRPAVPEEADRWLEHTYSYDVAGNRTSVVQPIGLPGDTQRTLTTDYTHDVLNQLETQTDPFNPAHTTKFEYNGEGQQTFRRDYVGAMTEANEKRRVHTAYNDDGSLRSRQYKSGTSLLSLCNWKAGEDPSNGYDADGNLVAARTVEGTCDSPTGTRRVETFAYDHGGFLDETTQTVEGIGRKQVLDYRADGALQSSTWSKLDGSSANTTRYANSPAGWMEAVTDWRATTSKSTFDYAPSGVLKTIDLIDDIDGTFNHQPDGSLASLLWEREASGADLRSHQSMTYDVGGLLESETVTITPAKDASSADSGGAASFEYDLAGRLDFWRSPFKPLEEDPSGVELSEHDYKLDDAGNILSEVVTADPSDSTTAATIAVSTTSSTYVHGRLDDQKVQSQARNGGLASTTSTDFAYSGLGDEQSRTTTITADGFSESVTRTSSYDAAGHTDEVSENGFEADPTLSYTYDGSDQLIGREEGSSGKRLFFYFLGTSHLAEETDAGGVTKVTYLNAVDGKALAEQKGSSWIWLLRDPKGSIATRVSASGDIKSQQAYDPYGAEELGGTTFATQQDEDDPSSLGFQGSHTDEANGNLLLGPRIYDPTIDRFTTADYFVGAAADMELGTDALTGNRYLFAAANPVAYFEDGHVPYKNAGGGRSGGQSIIRPQPAPPKPPPGTPKVSFPKFFSRIPKNGVTVQSSLKGGRIRWTDPVHGPVEIRIHAKGMMSAPKGSFSRTGPTMRVQLGKRYMDPYGNLWHKNVTKKSSPYFNAEGANLTHIPLPEVWHWILP